MRLYLVRHGESTANAMKNVIQGHLDTELTEKGREQAKRIAERLRNHFFDQILSSDLKRALHTAEAIAEHHSDTPFIKTEELRELSRGDYQGMTYEEVGWHDRRQRRADWYEMRPPNGENFSDLVERMSTFIDTLDKDAKDILVVTHGGAIRAFYHHLLQIPKPDLFAKEKIGNVGLSIIEITEEGNKLILDKCDEHLRSN